MAALPEAEPKSEEDVDGLKLPQAMRLCRKNKINLEGANELDKIKWLLKFHLLCQGRGRSEAVGCLSQSGEHDKTRRMALAALYDNTIRYAETLQNVNDPVIDELNRMFPDVSDSLNKEKAKILSDTAPVLVLGETGSGKSSFINLLLGESILPCSLLSNTHVICEIRYSGDDNKSYATLIKAGENGGITEVNDNGDGKFTEELAKYIQELDSNRRAVYKLASIYLPCEILKTGLMIVDSPGIGETKEMTDMVLGYILKASAFIYIIDSTNAGGMQLRVKNLVQKVYRKALEEQKICRPESAIFICNKWDEVSIKDREDVWEDTKKKIKLAWPECQQSQIIRFSTVEAMFIQDKGGVAPKFELILENINSLVPVGQEVLVLKGYRYIEQFVSRCILCFGAHLSQLKLSKEDREAKRSSTKERLDQLKSRITSFFDEQSKKLKTDIEQIADNLKTFINEKSNLEKVCSFTDNELPKRQNWNEAAVEVRRKVYESLRSLIKVWESSETQFGKLAKDIEEGIEKEFPAFDKEIYQAEKQIVSYSSQHSDVTEETEVGLLPDAIQNKIHGLSLGTKVVLGIGLSPVILVGMIVRLPVYGVKAFERFYSRYSLEKDFIEALDDRAKLKEVCQKYAKKTVESITDKMNMRQIIEDDMQPLFRYLRQQQTRMESQIQNDLNLLKNLKDEDRKDEDIQKVYEPMNAKFEILRECLQHFMLMHLPAKFASWIEEIPYADIKRGDKTICSGLVADILTAKAKPSSVTNNFETVCIREPKEKIKESKMKHFLKVLEAYKTIRRETIATCFGFWNPGIGLGRLYQILEPLQCSLRQFADSVDFKANHDNNCVRTVTQIVQGLAFLHDRKLVHFDISMDTIAIGMNGNVKLTNINPEMRVNIEPKITDRKVCLSDYVHMSPKFFQNQNLETYRVRDDMYGVGIIMWELWAEQSVVEIGKEYEIPEDFLKKTSISTGGSSRKLGSTKSSSSDLERSSSNENQSSLFKRSRQGSRASVKSLKGESEDEDAFEREEYHFQEYLKTFRPKRSEAFVIDNAQSREIICEKWWETLCICLDEPICLDDKISANKWIKVWEDVQKFPPVEIYFRDTHFSQ